jgi:hypothetical protein
VGSQPDQFSAQHVSFLPHTLGSQETFLVTVD